MQDLLHPGPETLADERPRHLARLIVVTAVGFACYGFTTGFWRSPLMGCYVAVKMPLLIACTLGCNGFLNGLLGILLGSGLGFRQSLQALLSAFAVSSLILGSLSPVTFFLALNAPPPDSPEAPTAHAGYLLTHTALIAVAGTIGLLRLRRLLTDYCVSRKTASSTLAAWLAGNAFLGAQFSWIFRPFFGSPGLEVAFLRDDPMQDSFYEAVWRSLQKFPFLFDPWVVVPVLAVAAIITAHLVPNRRPKQTPNPQPK